MKKRPKVWKYLYPEGWDTYASELAGEFTAEELQTALNKVSSEGRPSLSRCERSLVERAIERLEQIAIEEREDDLDSRKAEDAFLSSETITFLQFDLTRWKPS